MTPDITCMRVARDRIVTEADKLILGWFDFEARGFEFTNCSLFQKNQGHVRWSTPPFDRSRPCGIHSRIFLRDRALYEAVCDLAVKAYRAMGGQHLTEAPEETVHHSTAITRMCGNSAVGAMDDE